MREPDKIGRLRGISRYDRKHILRIRMAVAKEQNWGKRCAKRLNRPRALWFKDIIALESDIEPQLQCQDCGLVQKHTYPMCGKIYCINCGVLIDEIDLDD